jgi:hypothetical protein
LTLKYLMVTFAPFFDWKMLGIEEKRKVLAATVLEIHVKDYVVSGIALRAPISPCGDNETRKAMASLTAAPAGSRS